MALKITDANYLEYKKVFEIVWKHQSALYDPEVIHKANPIDFLNALELKSKAMAKRGLQSGLNDVLLALNHLSVSMLQEINADLEKDNLPSIAAITAVVTDIVQKVLKKKRISTTNEYYIIKEYLMAPDDGIAAEDLTLLYQYQEAFELTRS